MDPSLLKFFAAVLLVHCATASTYMQPGCPEGALYGSTYFPNGCEKCVCMAQYSVENTKIISKRMSHCVTCPVFSLEDCQSGKTVKVHPDARYPGCCEVKCQ